MPAAQNVNTGTRLKSMLIDHFIMTLVAGIFFIPLVFSQLTDPQLISHEEKTVGYFFGPIFYIALLGFALYFCKDSINGQSFAKRMTKLQVADNGTGDVASPFKCFIRNIFCLVWPVEVIVILINPQRRIGDLIAGTKVIYYDQAPVKLQQTDLKKLALPLCLSFLLMLLLVQPFRSLQLPAPKPKYVASSYNESESKALEKLYSDSLGQEVTADVRIYDTILNHRFKYVDIIFRLKKNYLSNIETMMAFKKLTIQHLYSVFPENTITGVAQYVYQKESSGFLFKSATLSTSSSDIGVIIIEDSDK
jgi:uncharacterized RDD family membrane protein YckC